MASVLTELADITSVNSRLYFQDEYLYPDPVRIQQFASDNGFSVEGQEIVEYRFGVDGFLSPGYVPNPYIVTVNLEASSPSWQMLSRVFTWCQNQQVWSSVTLTAEIPAINRRFIFVRGVLTSGIAMPGVKRVLDPTEWKFAFAGLTISEI